MDAANAVLFLLKSGMAHHIHARNKVPDSAALSR